VHRKVLASFQDKAFRNLKCKRKQNAGILVPAC
jgi:hypothetical protein